MNSRTFSNTKKLIISTIIGVTFSLSFYTISIGSEITSNFVDLSFTINNKNYISNGAKKTLETAPFVSGDSSFVPLRCIFEELGYQVEWNNSQKSVTATAPNSTIKLQVNSKTGYVNGVEKQLIAAPQIVKEKVFVPLRFVSENSGASVVWDDDTKSILITRAAPYDTGKIAFYEKAKNKVNVYTYDGNKMIVNSLINQDIIKWYKFKDKALIALFDKKNNTNILSILKDGTVTTLKENFDIKSQFEYNDNFIIHGYDRAKKVDGLYRFDGEQLILIENNFLVGNHFILKDKLIINKYNNKRQYSLVEITKKSWEPNLLSDGFIIKNVLQEENGVYMAGVWQNGSKKPLACYSYNDGFQLLYENVDIDITKFVIFNNKPYAIINDFLNVIENNELTPITFQDASGYNIKYNLKAIKVFNDKLYLAVKGCQYINEEGKPSKAPEDATKVGPCIMEMDADNVTTNVIDTFLANEFRIDGNYLIILGQNTDTKDSTLYIYDGGSYQSAIDILRITNTLSIDSKTFFDIQDKYRVTGKTRNGILLYDGSEIQNLVLDLKTKYWSIIGDKLIFSGLEEGVKKNKVYSYSEEINELFPNFDVKYWQSISDNLFFVGNDNISNTLQFYKYNVDAMTMLKDNLEVKKLVKAKDNYYLVYSIDRNKLSPSMGKNILYIYDDSNMSFIPMKYGINIEDIIYMN